MPRFKVREKYAEDIVQLYLVDHDNGSVSLRTSDGWHLLSIEPDGTLKLASNLESSHFQVTKGGYIKVVKDQ